jgi:aryl-alcohol dehydrogenase-like predicted oxidoreductase
LNGHLQAGRVRSFGASNWSVERVEEANRYAHENGLRGFSAVSNNFSLARMVNPVWHGSISTSDAESRSWFAKTQMALFAWSSQARGFFVRGNPEYTADGELVRCWYSEDNFRRLERVQELAQKRGVSPINIALAYVLNQPFPTYALIGPRALSETRTSLPGLDIELTADELRWLNLED